VTTQTLLVVFAHPDDETFGCGSVLAHAHRRGVRSVVACATRGEAGEPTPGRGLDDADMAVVREGELRAAAEHLGVDDVVLYDWRDSGMDGEPEPGTLCAADLDDVAARVAATIDTVRPTVVVTLDGSDGHRDHAHVRDATLLATERATHRAERVYLHCLPRSLMARWVDALRAEDPDSSYVHLEQLGTPEDRITTVVDTEDLLALREAAIALHRSQTSPYEVMAPDLRRAFLGAERLTRVSPPWTGGDAEDDLFPD
jgi:N-acetyl-1-D-myo-inositol-2-amino-2-deoxy-alpha-D-glucopyranoside deacetylase